MTVERNRGLLLACVGIALLLGVSFVANRPTAPAGENAPPLSFSALRAYAVLRDLVGNDAPHPIGSAAHTTVRNTLLGKLRDLGFAPELQTGFACNGEGECGTVTNIVARLDDAAPVRDAILLSAHYDSVPAGPGASDDGTGVAALLEIARVLKLSPSSRHPIILLITDGEEAGLLGACLFVSKHPLADKVEAVVNLDARGNSGPSLMFETGSASAWTIRLYGAAVAHPVTNSIFYTIYKLLPNGTDFTVFKRAGYQGLNLAFVGGVAYYHTPQDTWANVSLSTLQHQGDNALASLEALARTARPTAADGESIFFDVLGRRIVAWPVAAALPLGLVTIAICVAQALLFLVNGLTTVRRMLWSLLAVFVHLGVAIALCMGCVFILRLVGRIPSPSGDAWIAHPLPMHVTSVALAVFAAASIAGWFAKRVDFWSLWLAATLTLSALNLTLSIFLPGTSFITLMTSAAALCAVIPACRSALSHSQPSGYATDFAVLLPTWAYFATAIPSLLLVYSALGVLAWPIVTAVVGLGLLPLLAQLATAMRRVRRRVSVVTAVLALAGLSVTVFLPTYSAEWPQRFNFEYWLDADSGLAHWVAQPDSMHLPRSVREAAGFDRVARLRYAGSGSLGFMAPAAARSLLAPQLTLLSATETAQDSAVHSSKTRFQLHLQSMRGAPSAFLVFAKLAQVREVVIATADGEIRSRLREMASGATRLSIDALPPSGLDLTVDAPADSVLTASVYDVSYELPEGSIVQRSRPKNATSSQDGDVTIVQHTVMLEPAAGR